MCRESKEDMFLFFICEYIMLSAKIPDPATKPHVFWRLLAFCVRDLFRLPRATVALGTR
jgi:hypothetical protein